MVSPKKKKRKKDFIHPFINWRKTILKIYIAFYFPRILIDKVQRIILKIQPFAI